MYKILVSDIDGTLLRHDNSLSEKNKSKIKEARDNSIHVSLASGRSFSGVLHEAKKAGLDDCYHIADNGVNIVRACDNYMETLCYFDKDDYESLVDHLRETSKSFVVTNENAMWYESGTEAIEIMRPNNGDMHFVKIKDIKEVIKPFKIITYRTKNDEEEAKKILSKKYDTIEGCISFPTLIDFFPKETSKYKALLRICELLDISEDEIISIGDSDNDYDLIKDSHMGVAVKNASDKIKKVADLVIDYTNEEDAVAHLIEDVILKTQWSYMF